MDYPQYDDRSAGNAKDGAVASVEQMAVGSRELFVFRNQRTAFGELLKCSNLLLQPQDECSGVLLAVGSDDCSLPVDDIRYNLDKLQRVFNEQASISAENAQPDPELGGCGNDRLRQRSG